VTDGTTQGPRCALQGERHLEPGERAAQPLQAIDVGVAVQRIAPAAGDAEIHSSPSWCLQQIE